jgi:deazaflavin-dependent oxidoreductase (nitroreductase family)
MSLTDLYIRNFEGANVMSTLIFRWVTRIHIFLYRLTSGRIGGSMRGFGVLLLTTTGRKTGKRRTTPLGYFEHEGGYVVTASNAGFDQHPAWYLNLKSNPRVAIQVMSKRMDAVAEIAGPQERSRLWARLIELAPGYARYEERTKREIPMVILCAVR